MKVKHLDHHSLTRGSINVTAQLALLKGEGAVTIEVEDAVDESRSVVTLSAMEAMRVAYAILDAVDEIKERKTPKTRGFQERISLTY